MDPSGPRVAHRQVLEPSIFFLPVLFGCKELPCEVKLYNKRFPGRQPFSANLMSKFL